MTGKRKRAPRPAEWQKTAEEITRQKAVGSPDILSLTDVCDATGLKPNTIMSYVNRTGTTTRRAMARLMRPAYAVGATPYWSQDQLDAYFETKAQQEQERAEQIAGLPETSVEEAAARQWLSVQGLSRRSGLAPVTLHREKNKEGFPAPVAVVPSRGPNPRVVYDWAVVEAWLRARRPNWEPPVNEE